MVFKGNGVIWDKERNKVLCEFKNGQFETEDERTINLLTDILKPIRIEEPIAEPTSKTPPIKLKKV